MMRTVALAGWLATATFAASPLPPVGYVNLETLVASDPAVQRAGVLEEAADALRELAAQLPESPAPPTLAAQPPQVTAAGHGDDTDASPDAGGLELSLLREALADQIVRHREYAIAELSRRQARELGAFDRAQRQEAWRWQSQMGEAQRYERINLTLHLAELPAAQDEARRLRLEYQALEALTRGTAQRRAREAGERRLTFARAQARSQAETLRSELAQEERDADRELARRELDLAAEAQRREAWREAARQQLGEVSLDLELAGWRQILGARLAAVQARRGSLQEAYRAAADQFQARGAAQRAAAADRARPRWLAWLRHVAGQAGTELQFEPRADLPDLTDDLADQIAELRANPRQLAARSGDTTAGDAQDLP